MTDDPFRCRCVLCHDYGDLDEADRLGLTIIENVRKHGWHVVMVPEDDIGPGFAYTIGLSHTHGAPELAMFGLDVHAMHRVLNRLGEKAAGSTLADGQKHPDVVDGHEVALRKVDLRWYRTFFGRAIGFYRRPPSRCCKSRGPTRTPVSTGKSRLGKGTASHSLGCGCRRVSTQSASGPANSDARSTGRRQARPTCVSSVAERAYAAEAVRPGRSGGPITLPPG